MDISLQLHDAALDSENLHDLSRQLCRAIEQETPITASLKEGPAEPGTRGDPVTVGAIVMSFLGSGAAVALFSVFKAYFERHSKLEMTLQRADGKEFRIHAANLGHDQIERTISMAEEFLGGHDE